MRARKRPDGDTAPAAIDAAKAPLAGAAAKAAAVAHDTGDVELTVKQALKTKNFWLLVLIFILCLFFFGRHILRIKKWWFIFRFRCRRYRRHW